MKRLLPGIAAPFFRSGGLLKSTRVLASCAMLLALMVILRQFVSLDLTPSNRINFGFAPLSAVAYLYGPVPAAWCGALADILGYLVRPTGWYHPGFTLTGALSGVIYGLCFYRTRASLLRAAAARLMVDVFLNLGLNTLWLTHIQGDAAIALMLPRALRVMVMLPVDIALIGVVIPPLSRVVKPIGPSQSATASPSRRKRIVSVCAWVLLFAFAVWANNTSLGVRAQGEAKFLAHRGLAQTFDVSAVVWDTDTSKIIDPPAHEYLENTIPSMREAFRLGASVVELDVRRTADDRLAVFHDDLIGYRTNGSGRVSEHTMSYLKTLDIGYGYTADDGETWPFRGKGVGRMPELQDVLEAFPNRELLIHIKDEDARAGEILLEVIGRLSEKRLKRLAVYGDETAIAPLRAALPALRAMSPESLTTALLQYEMVGWTGYIPESLRGTQLHIPLRYAKYLWGWPAKFVSRMNSVGTRVVLVEGGGGWSEGFDSTERRRRIPSDYKGYVWTNRIDIPEAEGD